jgi:hypothetical protein
MNQIAIRQNQKMPTPSELQQFMNICNVLATTPFYAKMGAGGVLAIWLTAHELGLPPMMCLNGGMYTFSGAVTLSAQLMNMMIVNAGHRADVISLNHEGCKIRFVRTDRAKGEGDVFDYEFTMQDAIRAGYFGVAGPNGSWIKKPKDNWASSPRDMFYSRTLSGGARKFMPDVLMNCYVVGEMPGDDDIKAPMPENTSLAGNNTLSVQHATYSEVQQLTEQTKPDPVMTQEYRDFVAKHDLENSDSRKAHYINVVKETCERMGKARTFEEIVAGAMKDEGKFIDSYGNWELKQAGSKQVEQIT